MMTQRVVREFDGANKDERWWHSDGSDSEDQDRASAINGDDEFYDPSVDDKDAEWTHKSRQGRVSDAILCCPGCFTTLTVDCQKHAQYHNQYRAMLVMNCTVDSSRVLLQASQSKHGSGKKQRHGGQQHYPQGQNLNANQVESSHDAIPGSSEQAASEGVEPGTERFHPVTCAACGTEVGVQDHEEVYHFFHVFPSNA